MSGGDGVGADGLDQAIEYMRRHRDEARGRWVLRLNGAGLLAPDGGDEAPAEVAAVHDALIDALATADSSPLRAAVGALTKRLPSRGDDPGEALNALLLLRDAVARTLLAAHRGDADRLQRLLDAWEPAVAGAIVAALAGALTERERVLREENAALRGIPTPVLSVRAGLLLVPVVGVLDAPRLRQLAEQTLRGIRGHRARAVVVDLSGTLSLDAAVAASLVQMADAARLLGAVVIVTGLSAESAQALVSTGVSVSRLTAVGDLQAGLEEAEARVAAPRWR